MQTLTVYNQHVLQALKQLSDNSIDCIVTSPPYYGLRSYKGAETDWNGWFGQLGLEPTYQMYIEHLLMVTAELKRILKPSGTLFWNMGDSYASEGEPSRHKGYPDPKWAKARNGSFDEPTSYPQGIKSKSLMLLPERFSIEMIEQGWILRNKIIWYKPNSIPSSVKDRLTNKWEYVFFFVKSKKYYFNLDTIRKPSPNTKPYHSNDTNHRNAIPYHPKGDPTLGMRLPPQPWQEHAFNPKGANPGDVMIIPTKPHTFAHFAVFPETLVEPLIKVGCPQEGVVLDPFAGSGTTLLLALNHGLDAIGIEISKDYIPLIERRTNAKERQILGTLNYRLIT